MSRAHRAGRRKSSPGQSASQILIWIAMTARKIWASQAENSFHLGRGYVHGEQFSSQPEIDDTPVQSGKAFPNTPTFHPASIDTCGSFSRHRGLIADVRERMGHIRSAAVECCAMACVDECSKSWAALARIARASTILTQAIIIKDSYYLALCRTPQTNRKGKQNWEYWLVFFLKTIAKQKDNLAAKVKEEQALRSSLPAFSRQILELAKTRREITVKGIEESTGANRNTIKVHVKKLDGDHYLTQVAKGRGARYTIKLELSSPGPFLPTGFSAA